MAELYAEKNRWVRDRLPAAVPEMSEQHAHGLAKLLVCAAEYGAGDALAGHVLQGVSVETCRKAAELLSLEANARMSIGSGPTAALTLLGQRSRVQAVTELLEELHLAATSGKGLTCGSSSPAEAD